jgi:hypothetical protein
MRPIINKAKFVPWGETVIALLIFRNYIKFNSIGADNSLLLEYLQKPLFIYEQVGPASFRKNGFGRL